MSNRGGNRPGAGRKKGSLNKATIALQSAAEVLDVDDGENLEAAIHRRGHSLLREMERIALDPTQPVAARIMATKTVLPFLLPKSEPTNDRLGIPDDELVRRLHEGRQRLLEMRNEG